MVRTRTGAAGLIVLTLANLARDQPDWVRTGLTIGIAVSLVGLGLIAAWWRQAAARGPAMAGR